ncbi:MAG: hypothetical protein U5N86_11870 [Planctomycetota bacterium]|nr:hypothetical protein [Planctomycetota bacterium]
MQCPVCSGNTTGIIDIAELSQGHTFINKNMFPIFSYDYEGAKQPSTHEPTVDRDRKVGTYCQGGHWLQWLSTEHDADLHNMTVGDIAIVLSRLAAFEGKLMGSRTSNLPVWTGLDGDRYHGFVGIIRNFGQLGGASLAHGHLQIVHTNVLPRAVLDDRNFFGRQGCSFGEYMLKENAQYLNVRATSSGRFQASCPLIFMKRPSYAMIVCTDG